MTLSERTINLLWNIGYGPDSEGKICVGDMQGQTWYEIIAEKDEYLILFGGMSHHAFSVKMEDLMWNPSCQIGYNVDEYVHNYPMNPNGNWPRVKPDIRRITHDR